MRTTERAEESLTVRKISQICQIKLFFNSSETNKILNLFLLNSISPPAISGSKYLLNSFRTVLASISCKQYSLDPFSLPLLIPSSYYWNRSLIFTHSWDMQIDSLYPTWTKEAQTFIPKSGSSKVSWMSEHKLLLIRLKKVFFQKKSLSPQWQSPNRSFQNRNLKQ